MTNLVDKVQNSVIEIDKKSQRVDSDKSLEFAVRERAIEEREKNARDVEASSIFYPRFVAFVVRSVQPSAL